MFHPSAFVLLCLVSFFALISRADQPAQSGPPAPPAPAPNILFLYADDWRFDTLGSAGNRTVKTPCLDHLATESVSFVNSYVSTSICGVSRASLLTGQMMSRHGNLSFAAFRTPWKETLPGLLRDHGYWVGHVGKWHCGKFPSEHFDFGKAYHGKHWIKQADGSLVHVTAQNQKDALEFLRSRPTDKPFFLTVAFCAPHAEDENSEQYLPQPSSAPWYAGVNIPIPPTATPEATAKLPVFLQKPQNESRRRWSLRFDTPEKYQNMVKNYYRLCSEVDASCGALLAELDRQGLSQSTIVVFTGDNGYFLGEKGLADKWYPYEESIRVPLIIRDPRLPASRKGQSHGGIALNIDLAPTLLAKAGISASRAMQGHNLDPLLRGETPAEWRKEFFYEHPVIKSKAFIPSSKALVSVNDKYILWPDFDTEELFDLRSDPREEHNLIADPKLSRVLPGIRKRMQELQDLAK